MTYLNIFKLSQEEIEPIVEEWENQPMNFKPHNTAIPRKKPSIPVQMLHQKNLFPQENILDFGCGRGHDVEFLKNEGFQSHGFDPHVNFEKPMPDGTFEFVIMNYVINVIPSIEERISALQNAWEKVSPGGKLFISSRTPKEIENSIKNKKNWIRYNDGWAFPPKQTFQKGYNSEELADLTKNLTNIKNIEINPLKTSKFANILIRKEN